MKLEPIEKITTYKQYSVDSDLLLPSYVSLCTNERLPSPAEAKILTMDIVLRVASARERVLLRASELGCKTPTIASAPEDVVRAIVAESFDLILRSNEGQAMNSGNAPSDNSMSTETTTLKPSSKKGKMNGIESQGLPQNALLQVSQGNFRATAPTHEFRQNGVGGGASKVRTTHTFNVRVIHQI
jgi:hypothetical protein